MAAAPQIHLPRKLRLSFRIFRAFIVFTSHPLYLRSVTFLMGMLGRSFESEGHY